jgi:TRAP-type C4-dicarboxylate transport system permease small subunit
MPEMTRRRRGGEGGDGGPSLPRQILRALVRAEKAVIVVLMVAILLLVVAQVVMRFVFQRPLFWSDELARYCYVWLSFIAAVAVTAGRTHIRIDVINYYLGPRGQRLVEMLAGLLVIGTCSVLVVGSWQWLMTTVRPVSPALGLPMVFVYGVVWLAFLAMALHSLVNLALFVTDREEPADAGGME